MSVDTSTAPAPATVMSRAVGVLGLLCLLPVALAVLLQGLHIGLFQTLNGVLPISDSNLWAQCASALASGHESYNLAWCLRRPLAIVLQAPLFVLAPRSMAAVVLVQLLVVCLALWWFLLSLVRTFPVRTWTAGLAYVACLFPVLWYGTYLGPEAIALALSFLSVAALLRFARGWSPWWAIVGVGLSLVVLQMRPGNPLLVGVLAIGSLLLLRRAGHRWLTVAGVAAALAVIWLAPPRVLAAAGWSDAGHAANLWSAAYSAATPEDDSWMSAYDRFAPEVSCPPVAQWTADPCLAFESDRFGQLLREATIAEVRAAPTAMPRQFLTNATALASAGYLNEMGGHPYVPTWRVWDEQDRAALTSAPDAVGTWSATLLWAASWVLAAALVVTAWRRGRALLRTPDGLAVWVGLACIGGAFASYALVGHVEPQRHLVQNIPYVVLGTVGLLAVLWPSRGGAVVAPAPRWMTVLTVAISGAVLVGAVVEGHAPTAQVTLARGCAGGAAPETYDVVAVAPVGTEAALASPADWRRADVRAGSIVLGGRSWMAQMAASLPPGMVLDLRATASGEVVPVFVAAADAVALEGGAKGSSMQAWCTRTPSATGVMVVHDLVPQR